MEIIEFQKKVEAIVAKRGRPEKAYIGELKMLMIVKPIVTVETIFNERRYSGKIVLRYGNELVEVKPDKKPEPTPAYNPKPRK